MAGEVSPALPGAGGTRGGRESHYFRPSLGVEVDAFDLDSGNASSEQGKPTDSGNETYPTEITSTTDQPKPKQIPQPTETQPNKTMKTYKKKTNNRNRNTRNKNNKSNQRKHPKHTKTIL